jgi:uncharacterized membrane protein
VPARREPPVLDRLVWWLVAANVLAVAGLFLYAMVTASLLPQRYPAHFDGAGDPDRWARAGSGEWYLVPGIGAAMMLFMVGLGLGLPRIPLRLWNMPSKKRLLALGRERQVEVIRSTVVFLMVLSLLHSALFFDIQRSMLAAASSGHVGGTFLTRLIVFGVVYLGYVVWWLVRVRGSIRRD